MTINIIVAYATPEKQVEIAVTVDDDCTVAHAIEMAELIKQFPEIDLQKQAVGIWGKKAQLTDNLQQGDRVEVYRDLIIDPKQARLLRAQKKK